MIVRSSFALVLILIIFIHTLYAINPAYFRQRYQEQELASLIEALNKQLNDQPSNIISSKKDPYNEDLPTKRNKYPNFHVSPLWLSRRTRSNRLYGKTLWISRTG